jgi:hypothetical protein
MSKKMKSQEADLVFSKRAGAEISDFTGDDCCGLVAGTRRVRATDNSSAWRGKSGSGHAAIPVANGAADRADRRSGQRPVRRGA